MKGGLRMKQKYVLGIIALSIIAILGISAISAFGFGHKFTRSNLTGEEKTALLEQKEAFKEAIENEDYDAWKALMEEKIEEMQASLTEENFNDLIEKYEKMSEFRTTFKESHKSGDYSKIGEFKKGFGSRKGHFRGSNWK